MGAGSVRCRVIVRNDESRIFTVTVDAFSPADRSRAATPSAIASSVRSIVSRSFVSTSNVCSWLIDLAASASACTGSSSIPRARPCSVAPCFPNRRTSRSTGSAASSPSVPTPYSRSAAAIWGPTPHSRPIASGARKAASSPGGTTTSPSGLRRSDAIFATSFVLATPTDAVSCVSSWIASLIRRAAAAPGPHSASVPVRSRNASSMETGSTSGVNRRRIAMTRPLSAWYLRPSTGTKMPCGQSAAAVRSGIADRTPNTRAS